MGTAFEQYNATLQHEITVMEGIQRDLMEVVSETIDQLRSMDGMTFLLNELLWLEGEGRSDIQLSLVKNKG
ncbi:hypothetical protein C1I60_08995 [Paenibacillus terrae]|uniref:Uncharacterized protein n=2 Tax=Paenibacillus terrae TaxID=159743 RepID=A0A4U2Q4H3_9BACL|nr:hypothetical protein C1I60_08995 [Paenibacillus terrae]